MATTKDTPPLCLCGCEGTTKGGRFLPGHDAKLKSSLVKVALAGGKRAEKQLFALGWAGFLHTAREKQKHQEGKKPRAKMAETSEVTEPTE